MGQAKQRGDFLTRQAEGIRRMEEIAERRRVLEAERIAAMTPEQRAAMAKARAFLSALMPFGLIDGARELGYVK